MIASWGVPLLLAPKFVSRVGISEKNSVTPKGKNERRMNRYSEQKTDIVRRKEPERFHFWKEVLKRTRKI